MACECFYKHNNHKNDQTVASGHSVRLLGQVNLSVMSSRLDQQIQFGWHDWQIHLTKQLDWLTLYHWMINFMIVFSFMKTPTSHGLFYGHFVGGTEMFSRVFFNILVWYIYVTTFQEKLILQTFGALRYCKRKKWLVVNDGVSF